MMREPLLKQYRFARSACMKVRKYELMAAFSDRGSKMPERDGDLRRLGNNPPIHRAAPAWRCHA